MLFLRNVGIGGPGRIPGMIRVALEGSCRLRAAPVLLLLVLLPPARAVESENHSGLTPRAKDSLTGLVMTSQLSESAPPAPHNPGKSKWTLSSGVAATLVILAGMGLRIQFKRRAKARKQNRQALADTRRLQNKIQLLFRSEPSIPTHLVQGEMDILEFLRNIGFVTNLEKEPARFLASCKVFKPNLILASNEFRKQVEAMVEKNALLLNTPVVYLGCQTAPPPPDNRVRADLEAHATIRDLGEAIFHSLRRSPAKIRYSVQLAALKGEIQAGTLVELLYFLTMVKRSGLLLVLGPEDGGEVVLHQGEIARATGRGRSADFTGARAVEHILDFTSGTFEFHEKGTQTATEAINTKKLLLDWAKTRDERNHDIGA